VPHLMEFLKTNPMFTALALLNVCDVLMGLVLAFGTKTLSSSVSWQGTSKKVGVWIIVAVGYIVRPYMPEMPLGDADFPVPLPEGILLFFLITEAISVLENGARLGIPLPWWLKDSLIKVVEQKGKDEPKGE
jgi:toxin secretion/phage lysis holin